MDVGLCVLGLVPACIGVRVLTRNSPPKTHQASFLGRCGEGRGKRAGAGQRWERARGRCYFRGAKGDHVGATHVVARSVMSEYATFCSRKPTKPVFWEDAERDAAVGVRGSGVREETTQGRRGGRKAREDHAEHGAYDGNQESALALSGGQCDGDGAQPVRPNRFATRPRDGGGLFSASKRPRSVQNCPPVCAHDSKRFKLS